MIGRAARGERERQPVPGRRAALLLLLAVLLAPGCGERARGDETGERWPLQLELPAVLSTLVLSAPPDDVADLLEAAFGWRARGLAEDGAVLVAALDQSVLGGPLVLLLPVADEDGLRASLAEASTVTVLSPERVRVELPATHPVLKLLRLAARFTSASSAMDVLAALQAPRPGAATIELRIAGGWAVLAPSREAALLGRRLLEQVPGLALPGDADLVLGVDLDLVRQVFHDELSGLADKGRTMLLGASAAGFGALLSGAADELPALPIRGEAAWALVRMASPVAVRAAQVQVRGLGRETVGTLLRQLAAALRGEDLATEGWLERVADGRQVLRLLLAEGTPARQVVDALAPAPPVAHGLALGFDPGRMPAALAGWLRPLVEVAQGRGSSCEAWLSSFEQLLAPLGGAVVLHADPPAVSLALRPGARLDGEALAARFAELYDALATRPEAGEDAGEEDDGVGDESGDPRLVWRVVQGEGVLVLAPEMAGAPRVPDDELLALGVQAARAPAPAHGPVAVGALAGVQLEITVEQGEVAVHTALGGGEGGDR